MNKKHICIILILGIMFTQLSVGMVQGQRRNLFPPKPRIEDLDHETLELLANRMHQYIQGKMIINTFNSILLVYIVYFYYKLYRETSSTFSLGLISLSVTLLVYSIANNPMVLYTTASNSLRWLGIFNFIPDLFTTLTSFILIYLSRQ